MPSGMNDKGMDLIIDKAKASLKAVADRVPLPLHYILNGLFILFWLGDVVVPDFIPFLDEILGAGALYYYNLYLLKRTFGVINPLRILRGESPAAKQRLGLLPWEQRMDEIKKQLKGVRKAARQAGVPGVDGSKLERLGGQVGQIEKRLRMLDRLLSSPAFKEREVNVEIAKMEATARAAEDVDVKNDYAAALGHAREHLANIGRIKEERNRLVAKLDLLSTQLDNTYSRLLAAQVSDSAETEAKRLMDELFNSVSMFDSTLQELEARPTADLYQEAMKEVEQTEEKVRARPPRQSVKPG